ncbi:MAG: lamin tail domain-containing protein [Parabacteroides sp.]|nr:lamin tail domain-containing protein [Parabacteroides sp.]
MKQISPFCILSLLFCILSCVQNDSLSNPYPVSATWQGDRSQFIETDGGGFSLNSSYTSGEATVYMPVAGLAGQTYRFTLTTSLNPSSRNYARVYLWSEQPDTSDPGEAFFIRSGYTKDNVSLCRQTGTKTPKVLIDGKEGLLGTGSSEVSVCVTVDKSGVFRLFTRLAGQEERQEGEYVGKEALPSGSGYFMLNCKFTKSGRNAFAFSGVSVNAGTEEEGDGTGGTDVPAADAPVLNEVRVLSPVSVCCVFDRPVTCASAVFRLGNDPVTQQALSEDKKRVTLTFTVPLEKGKSYELHWTGVKTAAGETEASGVFRFVYPETGSSGNVTGEGSTVIHAGDLVINEILFDPFAGASEYFELYNRSTEVLDVSRLAVTTRKESGELRGLYSLDEVKTPVFPGGYLVLTKQKAGVLPFYTVLSEQAVCQVGKLPVLSNQSATLVVLDKESGEVIDEVSYSSRWHSALAGDTQGVSLERISPDGSSQEPANWASASAAAGYGTPGCQNSQSAPGTEAAPGEISFGVPEKGNGGYCMAYTLDGAGYLYKSTVFDAGGKAVAEVASGETLSVAGTLRWNGKTKNGREARPGLYIWQVEVFHPSGKTKQHQDTFAVY